MLKGRSHILIGSLLVAVAFWFSVSMSGTYRTRFNVPLTVSGMPADIALAAPLPETVDVLLEADGWQLLFINAGKQLAFEIPGSRLSGGVILTNRSLNEMMRLPGGVTAIRVYPETLFVQVDRYMSKRVPLLLGNVRMGFKEGFGLVQEPRITPDSVTLHGAERVLREIRSWTVEGKSYTDLTIPVAEEVRLKDSLRGVVRRDIETVMLYIPTEQLADMWFRGVRVHVRHVPADREVLLAQQTVDLSVRGGVNILSLYTPGDFVAEVEFEDVVNDTTGSIIPTVTLPPELKLLRIEPAAIRYTMRK
ncbi:MAG: hypothetical protein RBU27_07105 [Bacteroidota bacterium]|jgi:hypothetical protein|nr:hypothetical protein [Bacteroidota bacterium]